ncbi:MAG: hypothetical protein K1X75_11225 [Leptospirales bacterium]|nr:hypothetical protein [Leptospirales bacterium]
MTILRTLTNRTTIIAGLLLLCAGAPGVLSAAPLDAESFLNLPDEQAREQVGRLTPEEINDLISALRLHVRRSNPDLDRFYLAMEHLESMRATEIAQKRVDRLALAFACMFALIVAFQGWIFIDQRRLTRRLAEKETSPARGSQRDEIYRGE